MASDWGGLSIVEGSISLQLGVYRGLPTPHLRLEPGEAMRKLSSIIVEVSHPS